jgi:arylsulfatase A-like enzyme
MPNIVFMYADDQRWDAMGVVQREQGDRARFPWFQTPNMDRLAAEGLRFRNTFVVNSLCAPSRAIFLTGRYSHLNGVANNHTPFPVDNVTHASLLRQAGYVTGYVGKWHMDNQSGQRPGFDWSASFVAHGRYFDCPVEVNGVSTPTQGWVDDVSTDYAIDFLRKHKARPFLLVLGFKSPHGPFQPPERAQNRFAGAEARPPVNADALPAYRAVGRPRKKAKTGASQGTQPVNLNYFRCISAVDDNVGRVLQTLDELKLTDDTLVIYTSDNGYYLGEHGLGDKRSAYDESLRIPFVVRYPKLGRGRLIDPMVLNLDLAPTLLDFAGVRIPPSMQGRSWRGLAEGRPSDWRKAFFYCYFYERGFNTPTVEAVRTETAKLIKYPGHDDWTELFDLKADPYERKNLVRAPNAKGLLAQLEAEFARQAKTIEFKIPDYADRFEAEPPPRVAANKFVLDYRLDAAQEDRITDASGNNNHGTPRRLSWAGIDGGKKVCRFDGTAWIEVPKSPSLNCAQIPWTVEAVLKAEKADGVILSRGGESQGYALHMAGGRPAFTVRCNDQGRTAMAKQTTVGRWVHLAGVIADGQAMLYVDGRLAARVGLPGLMGRDPHDAMQIGADTGSPVLESASALKFTGLLQSVKIYSGQRSDKDIEADAAAMPR